MRLAAAAGALITLPAGAESEDSDNADNAAARSTVTITPDPSCQGEDFEGRGSSLV
ncbi:hypothetical protein [Streptomyces sp. NPDC002845]